MTALFTFDVANYFSRISTAQIENVICEARSVWRYCAGLRLPKKPRDPLPMAPALRELSHLSALLPHPVPHALKLHARSNQKLRRCRL
jgi:hypothetical protein